MSGAVWQRSKPDSIRFALLHPHICSSSRSQLDQRQAYARRERAGRIQGAAGAPDLPTPLEPMEPLQSKFTPSTHHHHTHTIFEKKKRKEEEEENELS